MLKKHAIPKETDTNEDGNDDADLNEVPRTSTKNANEKELIFAHLTELGKQCQDHMRGNAKMFNE